jgi:integrase/recombinase XerD
MTSLEVLKREVELQRFEASILGRFSYQEQSWIFEWLSQRAGETQKYYRKIMLRFLAKYPEVKTLNGFSTAHILAFADERKGELKLSSYKTYRDALSSLFSYLAKMNYIDKNPASGLRSVHIPENLYSKILNRSQIARMIYLEKNRRNRLILMLLFYGGLRVSEVINIRCGHLKLDDDARLRLSVIGKGNKLRVIRLPKILFAAAKQLFRIEKRDWEKEDFLFLSERRRAPISRVQIFRIIKAGAQRARIQEEVSPHWFRHSSASLALDNGAPIDVVRATLGHSSIATTGKYLNQRPKTSNSDYLRKK